MSYTHTPHARRFTPVADRPVLAYDSDAGVHVLIVGHENDMLRAECSCGWEAAELRRDYEQVKADHEAYHAGLAS